MDEEEELEDSRRREARARQDLEADGCPLCYPRDVDVSNLRDPPEEYGAIVDYRLSFPATSGIPLCAQLIAWRKFRAYQLTARRRFQDFEHELRRRRQRHGLDSPPTLTLQTGQQGPMGRWIEFQDYKLARLETMERKRDGLRKELTEPQTPDDRDAITHPLGSSENIIKRHMVLLCWIEQKRRSMEPGDGAVSLGKGAGAAGRQVCARVRRKSERNISSPVLDKRARISKPNAPDKCKNRYQTDYKLKTAPRTPSITSLKTAMVERKPGSGKEKKRNKVRYSEDNSALHQLRPRRVTKRQPPSCDRALVPQLETITRFGRWSKPPERWAPG